MEKNYLIDLARESIFVLIEISFPVLIVTLMIGFIIYLIQALTQIQEPTLSLVPKIISIFFTLLLSCSYIGLTLKTSVIEFLP